MLPTVHLNGTSGKELFRLNLAVVESLRDAIGALSKACPHGRDYHTQGPGTLKRAIDEHGAKLAHLEAVLDQMQEVVEHLVRYA